MKCLKSVTVSRCQTLVRSLSGPETWKQHLTSSVYEEGRWSFLLRMTLAFSCVLCENTACVCVSLHPSLHAHYPSFTEMSVFIKRPRIVCEGHFKSAQQQRRIEVLSPPEKQPFAADFDQVSSFGRRAKFPDNIACCGNRNLKVSGDTHVALSVHTWLHFYVWPSQTLWFSFSTKWSEIWHWKFILGTFIWWCWN